MLKKVRNSLFIFISMTVIGVGLLALSFLIPVNSDNLSESARVIASENGHQTIGIWQLDNFTDDLIINIATSEKKNVSLIKRAINIYVVKYTDSEYGYSMDKYCNGDSSYTYLSYSRYWHGYVPIIRFLLFFFNYNQIRTLNTLLQVSIFIYVCYLLYHKELKEYLPAYILIYYLLSPIATGFSLQYTFIFYVSFGFVALLIKYYERICDKKVLFEMFLFEGALISFFDILTYPIFSLCILLLTTLICEYYINKDKIYYNIIAIKCFIYSIAWCIGYVVMWAIKWILVCAVNGNAEGIQNAINQLTYRSSNVFNGEKITAINVVLENFIQYKNWLFVIPVIVAVVYVLYGSKVELNTANVMQAVSFLIVSVYPIVWYVAFKNHSYIHAWYTSRSLAASGGAVICVLLCIFRKNNCRQDK